MKSCSLQNKLKMVQHLIERKHRVIVAFSGGVDSSLLLAIAQGVLARGVIAVTVSSPLVPTEEIKHAQRTARALDAKHTIVRIPLLQSSKLTANARNRCYVCKRLIFSRILKIAERYRSTVIEASNFDDIHDFRPGLKALMELKVLSPFIIARVTKAEIRALARQYRLAAWNRPPNACLATRIPYGTRITPKILKRITRAEQYLHHLGIGLVRVRDHSPIARIEVAPEDFQYIMNNHQKISRYFRNLGFPYTVLDLKGYKTGSLN